jgi:hypothetical protein
MGKAATAEAPVVEVPEATEEGDEPKQLGLFLNEPVTGRKGHVGNLGEFPLADEFLKFERVKIEVEADVVKIGGHKRGGYVTTETTVLADLDTLKILPR